MRTLFLLVLTLFTPVSAQQIADSLLWDNCLTTEMLINHVALESAENALNYDFKPHGIPLRITYRGRDYQVAMMADREDFSAVLEHLKFQPRYRSAICFEQSSEQLQPADAPSYKPLAFTRLRVQHDTPPP